MYPVLCRAISGTERVGGALTTAKRELAADALYLAELNRRAISSLRHQFPEMSPADAYEIQRLNVERRVNNGAVVRGHKVGLSSRVMQQMMQTHEPDFGVTLEAGQVIMPGSCTRACDVAAGQTVRADFDGLGSVTTRFDYGRAHR
jgi:2-keto-4-pentenoate hydratase